MVSYDSAPLDWMSCPALLVMTATALATPSQASAAETRVVVRRLDDETLVLVPAGGWGRTRDQRIAQALDCLEAACDGFAPPYSWNCPNGTIAALALDSRDQWRSNFPVHALIAFDFAADRPDAQVPGTTSQNLSFFTGQEVEAWPSRPEERGTYARYAARLAYALLTRGPLPDGEHSFPGALDIVVTVAGAICTLRLQPGTSVAARDT